MAFSDLWVDYESQTKQPVAFYAEAIALAEEAGRDAESVLTEGQGG